MLLLILLAAPPASASALPSSQPWLTSSTAPADARARMLLAAMTLDEKLLLLAGHHSEDKALGNYIGRVGTVDGGPMNHGRSYEE